MFAGAVRETVLSDPKVIRIVNAEFVPVALKAALVSNPPDDEEGRLYREIARSRIAPQGICVANSAGRVLGWSLMFDNQESIVAFLEHSLKRFRDNPGGKQPVAAERYMKFPSQRLDDAPDSGQVLPASDGHPAGTTCPAREALPPRTIVARLIGRALGPDGKPVAATSSQDQYVEDRFSVPAPMQDAVARAMDSAAAHRVRLPDEFARLCVTHAYLGMLDVQPLSNPCGGGSDLRRCDFWAERMSGGPGSPVWRLEGQSDVFTDRMANAGPGDFHEVGLTWDGFIEMEGSRMTRLVLSAQGSEKLKFGSGRGASAIAAASLPAGHRIDLECRVRYGILGEEVEVAEVKRDE